ncbi:MAG: hypothetical protein AAGJ35_11655, partial [Myxococcota bacterium]
VHTNSFSPQSSNHANDKVGCPELLDHQRVWLISGLQSAADDHRRVTWIFKENNELPYSHMVSLEQFWNGSLVAAWQVINPPHNV